MNTRGKISLSTHLAHNSDSSTIDAPIHNGTNTKKKRNNGIRTPRPGKNSHLAMFDDEPNSPNERSSIHSHDNTLNEAQISSSLLEVYGREVPDNRSIEEVFKTRQKISYEKNNPTVDRWLLSSYQEPGENSICLTNLSSLPYLCKSSKENNCSSGKTKPKKEKRGGTCGELSSNVFSKNILMKSLHENKMEFIERGSPTTSTSGEDHDSDCIPHFVEMSDDPKFSFRPEIMGKGVLGIKRINDGNRFSHHGVKETTTSRRYLMDNIDDDDFLFKKKP